LRNFVCWLMIGCFPLAVLASDRDKPLDSAKATLYTNGTAWINGNQVPHSSAVFSGDVVQTHTDAPANLNALGSNVMIMPESVVEFEGNAVCVEHGQVDIVTSRQMLAYAGGLTVTPVSTDSTGYEVTDVDGSVQVAARQGDVKISDRSGTSTLAEGQQVTKDNSRKDNSRNDGRCGKKGAGAIPPGTGGILSSPLAIWGATGVVGGVMIWVFTRPDDPISPSSPDKSR
jgi:hypothetical protein